MVKSDNLNYDDLIQLDGAFSVLHINYGKSPIFHGVDGKLIAIDSRKDSITSKDKIEDVLEYIYTFDGTEKNCKKNDRIMLWKNFWLEYIDAFDTLTETMPDSVVTIYVGRQAIEIGFKYLAIIKTGKIEKTHDLGVLADLVLSLYEIHEEYMKWVDSFCKLYCEYIEGNNAEYFRFPEYKNNTYFAGNGLSIDWLSYNIALVLLKMIHFAGFESEIQKGNSGE